MRFNVSKCKVMTLNLRKPQAPFFLLGDKLDSVSEYKYIGIKISNKRQTSLITHHIKAILEKAEKIINCIRHFGFSSDGLRPATGIKMYKILVRPLLEYASQVLSYRHNYIKSQKTQTRGLSKLDEHIEKLEAFQNRALKKLIPCAKSTSPALIRLFAGVMPICARIEILKLRYFWKISHSNENNLAFMVLEQAKKLSPNTKMGFSHEVFTICCKLNCLDVWLKIRRPKENPLMTIKRLIVAHYLEKDIVKFQTSQTMFGMLFPLPNSDPQKSYRIIPFINQLGSFPNTICRRHFIFALLDNCSIDRVCPKCKGLFKDVLQHTLDNCPKAAHLRQLLKYKLRFYNAPKNVNIADKLHLFQLATYGKRVFKKVVCEYLLDIGMY